MLTDDRAFQATLKTAKEMVEHMTKSKRRFATGDIYYVLRTTQTLQGWVSCSDGPLQNLYICALAGHRPLLEMNFFVSVIQDPHTNIKSKWGPH